MYFRIIFYLLLLAQTSTVHAQESKVSPEPPLNQSTVKLTVGTLSELSRDPTFQYTILYTNLEAEKFIMSYERLNNPANYQRFFLHYKITLVESEDFSWMVAPGVGVSNGAELFGGKADLFIGAHVEMDIPAMRIHVQGRSYKGNNYDQTYVATFFTPLETEDQFMLLHFWNINSLGPSTSYLGPAANLFDGHCLLWIGRSLTQNASWGTAIQAQFDF